MRKTSLVLITIFSLFVTVTIFAQTAQSQAVPSPSGFSMPCTQRIVCDSVINLDSATVNLKALRELQKMLPVLDSLEKMMFKIDRLQDTISIARTAARRAAGHGHFMIDSLSDHFDGNIGDVLKIAFFEIYDADLTVKVLDIQHQKLYMEWNKQRDLYNAYAYPAKILFEQVVNAKVLNDLKTCRNATVYKSGKKLFSIHHYLTAYYAE